MVSVVFWTPIDCTHFYRMPASPPGPQRCYTSNLLSWAEWIMTILRDRECTLARGNHKWLVSNTGLNLCVSSDVCVSSGVCVHNVPSPRPCLSNTLGNASSSPTLSKTMWTPIAPPCWCFSTYLCKQMQCCMLEWWDNGLALCSNFLTTGPADTVVSDTLEPVCEEGWLCTFVHHTTWSTFVTGSFTAPHLPASSWHSSEWKHHSRTRCLPKLWKSHVDRPYGSREKLSCSYHWFRWTIHSLTGSVTSTLRARN